MVRDADAGGASGRSQLAGQRDGTTGHPAMIRWLALVAVGRVRHRDRPGRDALAVRCRSVVLGTPSFVAGSVGAPFAIPSRGGGRGSWRWGLVGPHVTGMGASYMVLLTACSSTAARSPMVGPRLARASRAGGMPSATASSGAGTAATASGGPRGRTTANPEVRGPIGDCTAGRQGKDD